MLSESVTGNAAYMCLKNPIELARKLLSQYDYERNHNLIEKIARDHNIALEYWPFNESILGILWECPPNHVPTIAINSNLSFLQQTFAIAHLLAHYFLGHGNSICLTDTLSSSLQEEQEANWFAAELLISNLKLKHKKLLQARNIKDLAELLEVPESLLLWKAKFTG